MENGKTTRTALITILGCILLAFILIGGTIQTGSSAHKDTADAVRSVSLMYLDELAGRRKQVVEEKLNDNIKVINIAVGLIDSEDLSDLDHMRAYQRNMKKLFKLKRFAFVDEDSMVYTADEGIQNDIKEYSFDPVTIARPEISIKNEKSPDKQVVIAVPIRDKKLSISGKQLVACFMEIDMNTMLQGVSMTPKNSATTFSNLYTADGVALTNTVLGGLAVEDNLLEALEKAQFDEGYTAAGVIQDFRSGKRGAASFTYNGIPETIDYVPVNGTNWQLTYLIQEKVISGRIDSISDGIIRRSVLQSVLAILVLGALFAFIIAQIRSNARLELEKETQDAENRVKQQEMEQRLSLQQQLLDQQAHQEEQGRMITALASDFRSVYYLDLDKDSGVCYQSRSDIKGLGVGEKFSFMEAVTAYCNRYVLPEYREEFMRFIQPDAIRQGLRESRVISYRYMINLDGKVSYEAVRIAGVRHPEDRADHAVHSVSAGFADVDAEIRKEIEQQHALSDALAAAEQANKAKTAFLSNMSHEIRTPMNAIIGLNSIAMNDPTASDTVKDYLKKSGASAQHLLGIINDILDLSRIESGRMVIKSEEFSFSKCLEQVNTMISGQCRNKGLRYDCRTIGKIDDYYVGDGMKLKQVMINILGNAVKFTPEGGTVTFLIEEGQRFDKKAALKFTIRDTGIGMSKEYLPHLFDAFSQENSSATSKYGSTGLGMPITKSIIELMNGSIEVESEKGVGTTFKVFVTLGESDHKDGTAADDDCMNPHEMSVLVIDDDEIALEHAQLVLGKVGISCDVALSGDKALEMVKLRHARNNDYDLLIIDWKMPGMDGVETTRQIRSVLGRGTPIIILTSYNWDEVADEAKRAGVDTFVAKPLFAGSVLDQFREAFRKKNAALLDCRADLRGRRVLLAEDVEVNTEIMVMVLSLREIEADTAENGKIAVEKFQSHPAGYYDAILMDMRMPEMDGLEATRVIRSLDRADAKEIPIIALTANAFDEDVQRSMQAGLNAHLSKPVEADALFDTLEKLIKA
ncbi:response regulator [Succinimonas sp.]|uniref:response regulator n=1 Tax=Succinimonas sp. TaxID=1936151 RepID=UPI00386437DB